MKRSNCIISSLLSGAPILRRRLTVDNGTSYLLPLVIVVVTLSSCVGVGPSNRVLEGRPPVSRPPVYNAVFDPTANGTKNVLTDKTPTTVLFRIGPEEEENALSTPTISSQVLLGVGGEVTVAMTCYVCEDQTPKPQIITYYPAASQSTPATWKIVPLAEQLVRGSGEIAFTITYEGKVVDYKIARVTVVAANVLLDLGRGSSFPGVLDPASEACGFYGFPAGKGADLVLWAGDRNGSARLSILAYDPELATNLASLTRDSNNQPIPFATGAFSWGELTATSNDVYRKLKSVVEGHANALPAGVVGLSEAGNYELKSADSVNALALFYQLGLTFHDTMFVKAGGPLYQAIRTIETAGTQRKAAGKPLRISIFTEGIYLPWQILHAKDTNEASPNGEEFWGHKFIISVYPVRLSGCMGIPAELKTPSLSNILYLEYAGTDAVNADVAALSKQFEEVITTSFSGGALNVAPSAIALKRIIKDRSSEISIILSYTHGKAGAWYDYDERNHSYRVSYADGGQSLRFAQNSMVYARDLDSWMSQDRPGPYLVSRPIVFLNGCETGVLGGAQLQNGGPSFEKVFLERGARAAIVTEAPIWQFFGYGMGVTFLRNLHSGMEAAEALYRARLDSLRINRNPFGLLYTFYGNGATRLVAN